MRAVIFDMDGVLIDSEPLWRTAERQVFAEVGLELSDADCEHTMGMRTDEVIAHWFERCPWQGASPAEVERRLTRRMQSLIAERGTPMPGVERAVAAVRSAGLALALASSSSPVLINEVLRKLGLTTTFDAVRSALHEEFGKPHPGVFLSTARELGLSTSECAVVEDSIAGVQSAHAAGMRVVAIPPPHLFEDPAYDRAEVKLHTLEEFTVDLIQ